MNKKVKKIIALLLAAMMVFSLAACGKEKEPEKQDEKKNITISFAHDLSASHVMYPYLDELAENIQKESNGRITVDVFGGGQLSGSNANETTNILASGDVQLAIINGMQTPDWDIFKLPYLFASLDDVHKVYAGKSGQLMFDTLTKAGIHGLGWLDVGFRHFTAKTNIADIENCKGLKMRIVDSRAFNLFVQALGGNPVTTSIGELYTALQQGNADTQENSISTIASLGFTEVAPYLVLTEHIFTYYIVAANDAWWQGLDAEAQGIIEKCVKETCDKLNAGIVKNSEQGAIDKMAANGAHVIELTPEQKAKWVAAGRSTHKELIQDIDPVIYKTFCEELGIK